jgi:2'-hydroxyisoflavone reductase
LGGIEALVGDRENDLSALRGRRWDAVIDNSGRRVAWTRSSAELLRDSVDLYVYTSSTGVYFPYLGSDIGEDTELALAVPEGIDEERSVAYDYGVMKANSELEARRVFGDDRTIVVRPTYMMGPGDGTDRFTYWPVRLSRGGEVMVPGQRDDPVQYIDARDVAEWMIRLIESRTTGTFNAVGPASYTGVHQFVYGVQAAFSAPAAFVMIPDYDFLAEQGIRYVVPWIMPTGNNAGSARVSNGLAIASGLAFRPLADSVRDIDEWWQSDAVTAERRAALVQRDRSLIVREPEIIAAWRARGGSSPRRLPAPTSLGRGVPGKRFGPAGAH